MPFYWPSCSLTSCLLLFSLSLLSFYGLVFWGWGLQTDWVLIIVSQPCITNLFYNNNNNDNNLVQALGHEELCYHKLFAHQGFSVLE